MFEFIHIASAAEEAAVAGAEQHRGVIGLLGLNWKLFLGQLVNFSIIVFVLWKWVFTPVVTALQNRTKKIEESLQDAENIKQQVAELEQFRTQQQQAARVEYQQVLAAAEEAAENQRLYLLQQAREQSQQVVAEAERRIRAERTTMIREVKEEMADLVVTAAEKILQEKLDRSRDAELIQQSLEKVNRMTIGS